MFDYKKKLPLKSSISPAKCSPRKTRKTKGIYTSDSLLWLVLEQPNFRNGNFGTERGVSSFEREFPVALLGLRAIPRWWSLQRSPRYPRCISGALLLRGGKGKKGKGKEEGRKGKEGAETPQQFTDMTPLRSYSLP